MLIDRLTKPINKKLSSRRARVAARFEIESQLNEPAAQPALAGGEWTILEPFSRKIFKDVYIISGDADFAGQVYAAKNPGRQPCDISCDCGCGQDYLTLSMVGSLEQITRDLRTRRAYPFGMQSLQEFLSCADVILILANC